MNKKKLPKVIVRSRDDSAGASADPGGGAFDYVEVADAKPRRAKPLDTKSLDTKSPDPKRSDVQPSDVKPDDAKPAGAELAPTEPHPAETTNTGGAAAAASKPQDPAAQVDGSASPSAPKAPSDPVAGAAPRTAVTLSPVDAQRRRKRALRIVDRHAGYSAVGGILPLPIVSFASVTAVTVRMVKVLSEHYGVAFEKDRSRAIVVGLVAGAMPMGIGTVASSALLYVVPVPGSAIAGLAVSSVTAAACTRSIGRIFVEHFESGAPLDQFRAVRSGAANGSKAS